jgi:hypothetical protein
MHELLKTILSVTFALSVLTGCKSNNATSPCIEAEVLESNCSSTGMRGYPIRLITKTNLQTTSLTDKDGMIYQNVGLAMNLPLSYQVKGKKIYLHARMATNEDRAKLGIRTQDCMQSPLIVLTHLF